MLEFYKHYEKVCEVTLHKSIGKLPYYHINTYYNVIIENSHKEYQEYANRYHIKNAINDDLCDIRTPISVIPFCPISNVFDNYEEAINHGKQLVENEQEKINNYRKEVLTIINSIFLKISTCKTIPFIAANNNKYYIKHNFHRIILSNGNTLEIKNTPIEILVQILLDFTRHNCLILTNDLEAYKKVDSLSNDAKYYFETNKLWSNLNN